VVSHRASDFQVIFLQERGCNSLRLRIRHRLAGSSSVVPFESYETLGRTNIPIIGACKWSPQFTWRTSLKDLVRLFCWKLLCWCAQCPGQMGPTRRFFSKEFLRFPLYGGMEPLRQAPAIAGKQLLCLPTMEDVWESLEAQEPHDCWLVAFHSHLV